MTAPRCTFPKAQISLYRPNLSNINEAAGILGHEVRHWLQMRNATNFIDGLALNKDPRLGRVTASWAHELDAYRFQYGISQAFVAGRGEVFTETMARYRLMPMYGDLPDRPPAPPGAR